MYVYQYVLFIILGLIKCVWLTNWFYGVVVSTLDFESSDLGSTPGSNTKSKFPRKSKKEFGPLDLILNEDQWLINTRWHYGICVRNVAATEGVRLITWGLGKNGADGVLEASEQCFKV
ncbi:hypothetical protein QVD17_20039 [Tagetes erecta]|uniref:Uncharacterized protein n=1 Tax=Tagetes erecta TaxID=13708 RepID=A0AAD8KL03_TARER|nr:hypothetical protein QVD17_20039 [Tagetes erecta]